MLELGSIAPAISLADQDGKIGGTGPEDLLQRFREACEKYFAPQN